MTGDQSTWDPLRSLAESTSELFAQRMEERMEDIHQVSAGQEELEEEAFLFHHESIRRPEVWAMSDIVALPSDGQLYKTPVGDNFYLEGFNSDIPLDQ